jgi:integrase
MIKRYSYLMYWWSIREAIEKSGVIDRRFFSTHDFRRCFARKVWEKYKDVDVLKRVLNHEDVSTTLKYLRQSGLQNIDIFQEMQG